MNFTQAIQSAIDSIDRPFIKRRVQARFDRHPEAFLDEVMAQCYARGDDQVRLCMDGLHAGTKAEIDPETIKKIIEILKIIMPLLLMFF